MKRPILKVTLLGAFALFFSKAQAQELQFDYDGAGNQIQRQFVCVNCTTFPVAYTSLAPPQGTTTATTPSNKKTTTVSRKILAYPNPLTQVLNLKWENSMDYYVSRIEVYSSSGVTIFKQNYTGDIELYLRNETIPFDKQVPGFYFVKALYSDGKQDIIKVIKIDK